MKRVLTIQDISCIGKCSLTAAIPILSAAGIEPAIVPTAVLSTHTMFQGFTFRDLTDDMEPILEHWKKEGFTFDAIYTGYLGSIRQIDIVKHFIDTFAGPATTVIVDPAMADNGKLYTGFDESFARKMGELCGKADIVLPNISEACLMLGEPYPGEDADEKTVSGLLEKMKSLGAGISVITGTSFRDDTFGFTGLISETGEEFRFGTARVPYRSHGTGDVFAAAFTGALLNDKTTREALEIAACYTAACIRNTYETPGSVNYAVNLENEIGYYRELLGL